jgi:hypothetical protein
MRSEDQVMFLRPELDQLSPHEWSMIQIEGCASFQIDDFSVSAASGGFF